VNDALSPESATAASVDMKRLLWLRMSTERRQKNADKPWSLLEQALKATDLLLQAGAFGAIVLDMSDMLPQHTMRIPLATWYRFRLAAEQARTAPVLLTQSPCAHIDRVSPMSVLRLKKGSSATSPYEGAISSGP
jgi:hypothetical protein